MSSLVHMFLKKPRKETGLMAMHIIKIYLAEMPFEGLQQGTHPPET